MKPGKRNRMRHLPRSYFLLSTSYFLYLFIRLSMFWMNASRKSEMGKLFIRCRNPASVLFCSLLFISNNLALFSQAADTISQSQVIRDGETILSPGHIFVLGFFSPENSTSRYVGIWYNNVPVQTVVWVANRETPISDESGVLTIGSDGNLIVLNGNGISVWSSNVSATSKNSTATLDDSGNLILSSDDTGKVLWESFDHPTDTFLPGMKIHVNVQIGENRAMSSWKGANDPSPGSYSMGIDPRGAPQIVIWEGSNRRWRSGHWNGQIFIGLPGMRGLYLYGFKFYNEEDDKMYITYTSLNSSFTVRFWIKWDGYGQQLLWHEGDKDWGLRQSHPVNQSEVYNNCGIYGKSNVMGSPICECIEGFEPKNIDQWNRGDRSGGCMRRTPLQCDRNGSSDGFFAVERVKLPDYADRVKAENMKECEDECFKNCSCNAYAFVDGIQCLIWSGDLVDVEQFAEDGTTLYVRVSNSESGGKGRISNLAIITTVVTATIFLSISIWLLWRFRATVKAFSKSWRRYNDHSILDPSKGREFSTDFSGPDDLDIEGKQGNGPELPLFSFNCVAVATNDFANENKLGKGGFGTVYKGTLPGGQIIAVKRLSRWSGQGLEEFKNEIILIAKLQHRNLVRLLGCCIEGEEKMLIYEYLPNKSLDSFLFDPAKQAQLDWRKRFTIIEGIARGLLYLHRDSRLRIIHRDLKASNILLDEEMNPKISDFGMARIFGGNQNEANTNRVVGTYGYMSPEYAMEGLFSVKSDVYSFGVLLLEIVSGKKNTSFHSHECSNLIRYAWLLWNDGKAEELVDPSIVDSCSQDEALRCIHVGMLCVQDSAIYRPTMSSVVLMLESESASLPVPKQPTFSLMRMFEDTDLSMEDHDIVTPNHVTVTEIIGR